MEANQRQELKFFPRGNQNLMLAEALDEVAEWARSYAEISSEEAQAFEDMLTCGMGWSDTLMDYETDPDGKVLQEEISPFEMDWDPLSRKRNLSDARWVARTRRMQKEDIEEQFPDAVDAMGLTGTEDIGDVLGKTVLADVPDRYDDGSMQFLDDESQKGIPVTQICWYENAPFYRVADPQSGKIIELDEEKYQQAAPMLQQMQIKANKQTKRKYFYAFFTKDLVLERNVASLQSGFRFQCMTGKRDHVLKEWFGIVRLMKDPQRWANKFFSTFLDIIDSNAKGGIMAEIGAVSDVREFEEKWSRADSIAWMNAGALSGNRIIPKPVAPFPQNVDRLMQFSIQAIHDVSGVNLELLGAVDRGEVGMVVDSRKKSAYTILAPFFDSLKFHRQRNAILLMECIKKFIPAERLAEVLKDQAKQVAPAIKQIDLAQLNVIIAESPQSENNRMMSWMFISQLLPQILPLQIPIPPSLLEYSPLPAGLIAEWKPMLEQVMQKKSQNPMEKLSVDKAAAEVQEKQASAQLKQAQAQKAHAEAMRPPVGPAPMQPPTLGDQLLKGAEIRDKWKSAEQKQAAAAKSLAEAEQAKKETLLGSNIFGRTS